MSNYFMAYDLYIICIHCFLNKKTIITTAHILRANYCLYILYNCYVYLK